MPSVELAASTMNKPLFAQFLKRTASKVRSILLPAKVQSSASVCIVQRIQGSEKEETIFYRRPDNAGFITDLEAAAVRAGKKVTIRDDDSFLPEDRYWNHGFLPEATPFAGSLGLYK